MPPANSDARAASWDRNLVLRSTSTSTPAATAWNPAERLIVRQVVGDGIKHPEIRSTYRDQPPVEQPLGRQFLHRARKGDHFLEDTNNTARVDLHLPRQRSGDAVRPNLGTVSPAVAFVARSAAVRATSSPTSTTRSQVLRGHVESEYHSDHLTFSLVHVEPLLRNFDQDNSSFSSANDAALFIGSSNIGDGAGRQLWNFKYGDLAATAATRSN